MLASSLSLLFGIALLAPTWPATGDGVHPSDAPDVDLRIRIERDEVRYDIAMNLGFVDEVIEIVREDDERLHPVEYEGLRYALEEHLKAAQKVTADGVVITPEFVDFEVEQARHEPAAALPAPGHQGPDQGAHGPALLAQERSAAHRACPGRLPARLSNADGGHAGPADGDQSRAQRDGR
jgi:hypothetical protein